MHYINASCGATPSPALHPTFFGCFRGLTDIPHHLLQIPLLTTWKGQLCARLNVTNEAALSWYLSRARGLRHKLGATYVIFEGAEGNAFLEQAMSPPAELAGDQYAEMLAAALVTLGNATVISVGARWVVMSRSSGKHQGDSPISSLLLLFFLSFLFFPFLSFFHFFVKAEAVPTWIFSYCFVGNHAFSFLIKLLYFPVASKVQALCSYLLGSSVQRLTTGHSYSVIMLHSQCSGAAKLKATETSVKVLVLNCSRKM